MDYQEKIDPSGAASPPGPFKVHFRFREGDSCRGGVTVAVAPDGTAAWAICSPKDSWSRRDANVKVLGRLAGRDRHFDRKLRSNNRATKLLVEQLDLDPRLTPDEKVEFLLGLAQDKVAQIAEMCHWGPVPTVRVRGKRRPRQV